MSWAVVAGAAATVVGGALSADAQRSSGNKAADAQARANQAQLDEWKRQFDSIQKLLAPFVEGGTKAFGSMGDLVGVNGAAKQRLAIQGIQSSPEFSALTKQGEDAILANASATGGLRGGNTQAALGQFRPQLLAQLIDQQYNRLGGLASVGQNAAAGVGNSGMQTASGIGNALAQQGAAQAGRYLSQGQANMGIVNGLMGGLGQLIGGFGGSYTSPNIFGNYSNPTGSTYGYQGAMLPDVLRGGG